MANTKKPIVKMLETLLELMDDIQVDIFGVNPGVRTIGYYGGKQYSYADWTSMKRAVQQVQKVYRGGSNKSYKYILKNREYNNVLRSIYYYKSKPDKTPKDYDKLEQAYKRLAEIQEEKRKERAEKKLKKEKETEELEKKLFGEEEVNLYDIKL